MFMFLWLFFTMCPMHALVSVLVVSKKYLGIRLTLKFPDCILPKYRHFEDTRSCTSFCCVISDFPDEKVPAW